MSTNTEHVELVGDEVVENIARAALFATLTGALAYVSFPFPGTPVPVTGQVLGVFLAGVFLGPFWGGAAMVVYLAAGAMGAPVWAGGSGGVGTLVGPTGGYLWSYPIAAVLIGYLVHTGVEVRSFDDIEIPRYILAMAIGTIVIYTMGVASLAYVNQISLRSAIFAGAIPFIPAEALKMAATIGIVRSEAIRAH